MTKTSISATLLALIFTISLYAQTADHCGFNVHYQVFDSIFPNFLVRNISARENGDQYEFDLYRVPSPAQKQFRRLLTDHQGVLLSTTDFTFECQAVTVAQDGAFICASAGATGIQVCKLTAPDDTIWTGIFGQPNLIPYNILDMGANGILITGAEPYNPPMTWYPKGFLLKIDANQQEEWMTVHDVLGAEGWFNRAIPSSDGGYFVEALYDAASYNFNFEDGIKFDQNGNLLWQTRLGTASASDIIGMTSTTDGGLLATVTGLSTQGPGSFCQFYILDAAGNVLSNTCFDQYIPNIQNYYANLTSEILPATSGGYLTGIWRAISTPTTPPFTFIRLDENLDTIWTKGFNTSVHLSTPLPGDAFLGYYNTYYGLDTIGLVKIGAGGELSPCAPVSAHHPSASNENVLHLSPNPANDELTLSLENNTLPALEATVQITSLLGNVMRQYKSDHLISTGLKMDVSELPAGWYMLQVMTAKKTIASKPLVIVR